MSYQIPQQEHHRQQEQTYRMGMHGGWTQGATWVKRLLLGLLILWLIALVGPRLYAPIVVVLMHVYMAPAGVMAGEIWQLVTAPWFGALSCCGQFPIFIFHLFYLFVFGPKVERELGSARFIRFYVIVAVLATIFSFLLRAPVPDLSVTPASAASAAIFAVMVAYAAQWPRDPFYVMGLFPMPVVYIILFLCGMEVLFMVLQGAGNFNVDFVANVGGIVIAFAAVKVPAIKKLLMGEKKRVVTTTSGRAQKQEYESASPTRIEQPKQSVKPQVEEKKKDKGKRSGFLEL